MQGSTRARLVGAGVCVMLLLVTPATAVGSEHKSVDESQLVPALSPGFEPWNCKLKVTGPVCSGERHVDSGWEPADLPCETTLWGRAVEDRHQTRFYDHDNIVYLQEFRIDDVEYLSISATGPPMASLRTHVRFTNTFDVRGDAGTITQTTSGVLWDLRPAQGSALFRAVGTLVEPFDGPATFTGQMTIDGVSTRYHDALLDDILDFDGFLPEICRWAETARR